MYYSKIKEEHQNILSYMYKKESEIEKYIAISKSVDNAINDINETRLDREKINSDALLQKLYNMVSYLSYYHKIYDPIDSYISNITTSSNIWPIHITLKVKAEKDKRIIRFVESLLLNLQGFVLIREIDMNKEKDYVTGEIKLEWYTAKKTKKAHIESQYKKIIPSTPEYSVEEACNIALWKGNLLPVQK
jgi:hypothetical protein